MKKNLIILAALVLVLGGAIAAFALLSAPPAEPGPALDPTAPASAPAETIYVVGGDPAPFVTEVRVQNGLDDYTIKNNHANAIEMSNAPAPDFSIEGMPREYLTQAPIKAIATACAALDALQIVAEGTGDLAAFGLASPRATVEVVYDNGTAVFQIGDEAPGSSGAYVLGGGTVYLVSSSKLMNMLLPRYGFADDIITVGSSGADGQTPPSVFTDAVVGGTRFPDPIVIEQPEEINEELAGAGIQSYRIISPIESDVDPGDTLTALSSVFGLVATEVVALADDPGALAAHGLAEPPLTTKIVAAEEEIGEFTLEFSEPDAEGSLFVRRLDRPFIYKLPKASIAWYDFTLFDYMAKMLTLPFIETLASIDVVVDDEVYGFRLEGEGEDLVVTFAADTVLNTDYFKKFYQSLVAAGVDSLVPEGTPEPAAAPVLQFVYRFRDGSEPDTVAIYPDSARRYFIRLNDGPFHYTKSLYVDSILADLPKVIAGEEVTPYL